MKLFKVLILAALLGLAGLTAVGLIIRALESPETRATMKHLEPVSKSGVLGITAAGFAAITTGMAYDQVVAILGQPGEEISSSDIAGHSTVMYQWKGAGLGNMNAMFQNGKLISKAQFGLK